jgi:hypothetical protein
MRYSEGYISYGHESEFPESSSRYIFLFLVPIFFKLVRLNGVRVVSIHKDLYQS